MNASTCAANQAAFESVCAGQNVSPPLCPCIVPGENCVVGCTDGECGFECGTTSSAGSGPQ